MTTNELHEYLESEKPLTLRKVIDIIYELKNDCITTLADHTEDQFHKGFYNGEVNAFYICLDLLEKVVPDGEEYSSLENRILALEHDKKLRDIRDKVTSLLSSMQYGTLGTSPERAAYYKSKLNEIFGSGTYQDTDCVTKETNDGVH